MCYHTTYVSISTQTIGSRVCLIDSKLSLDDTTMSDNNNAMHVAIGVAIGALATTIAADVFKGIKDLSYGIRNRIYIVYASIFEVRSLTISESSGNTSMPAVLLGHGIRTFDAVAKYEINEVVKASTQVGQTYLPTRAKTQSLYRMYTFTSSAFIFMVSGCNAI